MEAYACVSGVGGGVSLTRSIVRASMAWLFVALTYLVCSHVSDPDNGAPVLAAIVVAVVATLPLAHHVRMRVHWALWTHYHERH